MVARITGHKILYFGMLIFCIVGCGSNKADDFSDKSADIEAFPSSQYSGALLTNRVINQSLSGTSTLMDYRFSDGKLVPLTDNLALDSIAWPGNDGMYLFDRAAVSFRKIDMNSSGKSVANTAHSIVNGVAGDPSDMLALDSQNLLLALRESGKLVVIATTGTIVQTIDSLGLRFKAAPFRPTSLFADLPKVYVVHQGVDDNDVAIQNQRLLTFKWDGSQLAISGSAEGIPLKATRAQSIVEKDTKNVMIVGLCPLNRDPNCVEGGQRFHMEDQSLEDLAQSFSGYALWHQMILGESSNVVYGSVIEKESSRQVVVRFYMDASQQPQIVHSYSDSEDRLYGIFMDSSTKTLFVGGESGSQGTLTLYDVTKNEPRTYKIPGSPLFGQLY